VYDGVPEAVLSASGEVVAIGDLDGRIWTIQGGEYIRTRFDSGALSSVERGNDGFVASWRIEDLVAKVGLDGTKEWTLRYDDLRDISSANDADVVAVSRHISEGGGGIGMVASGEPVWNKRINASVPVSPAISDDGTLLAVGLVSQVATEPSGQGGAADSVRVYDRDGSLRWERETESPIVDVSLSRSERIVVGALENGNLTAYSMDGQQRWANGGNTTSVAISDDGSTIAVTTPDGVRAYDTDGELRWSADVNGAVRENAAVLSADGSRLLVSTARGYVTMFDSGELRWNRQFSTPLSTDMNADGSTWSVATKHGVSSVMVQTMSTESIRETERIEIDQQVIETPAKDRQRVPEIGWMSRCDENETTIEHRGGDPISVDQLSILTTDGEIPFTELTEYSEGETFAEGMSFTLAFGCDRGYELLWSGEHQKRTLLENDR
jgi:hypothetical protein